MIRKPEEHRRALGLRKEGKSIKEIARILGVSPSSVSLWVRNVKLSSAQKRKLEKKAFNALQKGRKKAIKLQQRKRKREREKITRRALKELGSLSKRDLFVSGIALYWAEGFKKDNRLGFASLDPDMINLFLRWLESLGVPKEDIRLRVGLNISHKERINVVQKYWHKQTGVPFKQFQKPFFQKFKWKKEFAKPREYFGVLRIRANNQGKLFMKIQGWIKGLKSAKI